MDIYVRKTETGNMVEFVVRFGEDGGTAARVPLDASPREVAIVLHKIANRLVELHNRLADEKKQRQEIETAQDAGLAEIK